MSCAAIVPCTEWGDPHPLFSLETPWGWGQEAQEPKPLNTYLVTTAILTPKTPVCFRDGILFKLNSLLVNLTESFTSICTAEGEWPSYPSGPHSLTSQGKSLHPYDKQANTPVRGRTALRGSHQSKSAGDRTVRVVQGLAIPPASLYF